MVKETKILIWEVSMGIVIYNMVIGILAFILGSKSSVLLGMLVGMIIGIALFANMAAVFQKAADMDHEQAAQRWTLLYVILRYVVFLGILTIILWKIPQINAMAVVVGTLGLKAGAYMQPLIHTILEHFKNKMPMYVK